MADNANTLTLDKNGKQDFSYFPYVLVEMGKASGDEPDMIAITRGYRVLVRIDGHSWRKVFPFVHKVTVVRGATGLMLL